MPLLIVDPPPSTHPVSAAMLWAVDLNGKISGSAQTIENAAQQVQGMVRAADAALGRLIAAGGLLLAMLLMYFLVVAGQRRIEEKIDQLQQAAPVLSQPAAVIPSVTVGCKSVHPKPQGTNSHPKAESSTGRTYATAS